MVFQTYPVQQERDKKFCVKNTLLISVAIQNKNGDNKSQIVTYKIEVSQKDKLEKGDIRFDEVKSSQFSCNNAIVSLRHTSDRG